MEYKSLNEQRKNIKAAIEDLQHYETNMKPPIIQELVLARRHLEDAYMRLGVARAYEYNLDPLGVPEGEEAKGQ